MRPPSPRLGLQWGFPKYTAQKACFRQDSNLRPSACEADVITTTLRKPIDHTMRGTSKTSTYVASFAKYCARPMPSTWSPWRSRPARSAVNRKVGGLSPPGNCYFCVLEISKQSQQVLSNREEETAGRDHIIQVSKATVAVILVMCLMHVYERRSCLTTKPRIQRLIA